MRFEHIILARRRLVRLYCLFLVSFLYTVNLGIAEAATYSTDHTFNAGDYDFSVYFVQQAHVTVLGGWIENRLSLQDETTGDLYGGVVNSLDMYDDSVVNVYSGAYINTYAGTEKASVLNLYGGRLPDRWLSAMGESTVNFYVRDYQFNPTGGGSGVGQITGTWADNQTFLVDLYLEETASHLAFHIVPEPPTAVLMVCSGLALFIFHAAFRASVTRQNVPVRKHY